MSQRNISALVGLILLTVVATWVSFNDIRYQVPVEGIGPGSPWWTSLLFWQGEQERSIRTHYGLDLVGGSQVVLQGNLAEAQPEDNPDDNTDNVDIGSVMEAARVVIENRVSGGLGVVEPLVQLGSNNRIIVELPEVDNPDQAIRLLRETGRLEFVDVQGIPVFEGQRLLTSGAFDLMTPEETETAQSSPEYAYPGEIFETVMTGADLQDAGVTFDQSGGRAVSFTLTDSGQDIFSQYTTSHIGQVLAITLDGVVISAPVIQTAITDRTGIITGGGPNGFALEDAESIAIKLKYGALPVPLEVVENRTIGPSLGQQSIQLSVRAGTIGLIVVLTFMLVYYRLAGLTACLTMGLYAVMNMALYKLIPVTLTVPAITGFILSIGMAVDANILVFERMKEELRAGRSLRSASEAGFSRAWTSIRDGNISTLITCYILFLFGSSFGATIVKGFAVTLAIGVVINLFTAVPATRVLMRLAIALFGKQMETNSNLWLGMSIARPTVSLPKAVTNAFQIVQHRRWYYLFSLLLILPGLVGMAISLMQFGTPFKLAIDYTGGTLWEIHFEQPVASTDLHQLFTDAGYGGTSVQQIGGSDLLVRTNDLNIDQKIALAETITSKFGEFDELRFESVGPTIGREVGQASGIAVAAASGAILLFIWYAFRSVPNSFRYGLGAVIALVHDILVTSGIFSILGLLLGWEVSALFLTALLTVIGYSVHDTIVVFDRLRENLPRHRGEDFEMVANRSLLETMNRSLGTSMNTLFVVGAILFFGGSTTQQFITVMLIGIISGTYSSIFNAVPFVVSWQKGDFQRWFRRPTSARVSPSSQ